METSWFFCLSTCITYYEIVTKNVLSCAGIGCPVPRIPAEASPLADHVSATRILCGALVFPTIATIVGKLMFSSVNSNLQRTILVRGIWWKTISMICAHVSSDDTDDFYLSVSQGGIAFVAIKGAFKVYFKQQQYLRQAHRKILNFPELDEAWAYHRFHPPSFWFHAALRDTTAPPHYWTFSQTLDLVFFSLWMWLFCLELEQRFSFISVNIIRPWSRVLLILWAWHFKKETEEK